MVEETTKNPSIFSPLGATFQEKVFQAMVVDKEWAKDFIEIFDIEACFDKPSLKLLASTYINHYKKYKDFPSIETLSIAIADQFTRTKADNPFKQQIVNILAKVSANIDLQDLPWIKEKAFEFCKKQTIAGALNYCIDIIETDQVEKIVDVMRTAVNSATPTAPGHDYNNEVSARYSVITRNPVATLIPQFDDKKILNGGLGSGEVGIFVAPTGVGKTHCLIHVGAAGIKQGKNVFHYSFELNERYNGIRYDSHLTQIPSLDCYDSQKEIQKFLDENKEKLGRLIIKEFPARTIGLSTIRAHLDRECARLKIRPDLLIIDYAGLVRSAERYELPRLEMQLVIQEFRTLGKEYGVPIWTALQSNKEGAKSEIIDTTNMAESYGQAAEADFVFGLQRDNNMRESGYGNGFIAKNRMGVDGIKLKVHLDTARSTLKVLSKEEQENLEKMIEDAKDTIIEEKKASAFRTLKNKIKSLKNEDQDFVRIV